MILGDAALQGRVKLQELFGAILLAYGLKDAYLTEALANLAIALGDATRAESQEEAETRARAEVWRSGLSQGTAQAHACHCAWHDTEALLKQIEPMEWRDPMNNAVVDLRGLNDAVAQILAAGQAFSLEVEVWNDRHGNGEVAVTVRIWDGMEHFEAPSAAGALEQLRAAYCKNPPAVIPTVITP